MRNILEKLKRAFTKNKKPIFKLLVFIGYVVALIFFFVFFVNINVVYNVENNIYSVDEIESLTSDYDCILILGAGVKSDGNPSPMLRDRLITGYEAYNHINSIPLFLTGDSEDSDYCETVTMKNVLLEKGVSEESIICDGYGLSTYESIWRAKNVYGYDKILIVSQEYHLYRAIYIANKMGLEADGLDASLTTYGKQPYYTFREYFARIKDVLYSELMPEPKYIARWEERYE